jgi:hypothetical protein
MPANHLIKNGWREAEKITINWRQPYKLQDLITIVEQRCWSSMFKAPPDVYARILNRLTPYFEALDRNQIAISSNTAVLRLFQKIDRKA